MKPFKLDIFKKKKDIDYKTMVKDKEKEIKQLKEYIAKLEKENKRYGEFFKQHF